MPRREGVAGREAVAVAGAGCGKAEGAVTTIVVSFWTNERFRLYAGQLQQSLDKCGIRYDIQRLPDKGEQNLNVHQKTSFIRAMLDAHPDCSVCWVDADAVVCSPLHLLDKYEASRDFAAHLHSPYPYKWEPTIAWGEQVGQLCGGTLWFANNAMSRRVLTLWEEANKKRPDRTDQENLMFLLEAVEGLRFLNLPAGYCWIDPWMRPIYPNEAPVVFHFGANVVRDSSNDLCPNVAGRWEYEHFLTPEAYGDDTTYSMAAEWLDGCGPVVEDWGCGTAYARSFFKKSRYVGLDGSKSYFCDAVVDLLEMPQRSPDGILLRHVLEHNRRWPELLAKALLSFKRRLCIVLYIPPEKETREIARWKGIPSLALSEGILKTLLNGHRWFAQSVDTATLPFHEEYVYFVERKL